MFDYISGKIASVGENKIVVDVGGVGFLLTASNNACAEYGSKPEAKIPVYLAVREDALELYGFSGERERMLFMKLIGVSGVGAKLAIAVLGGMSEERLMTAIANADTAALSSIKGVGKKTAERIALELKNAFEDLYGGGLSASDIIGGVTIDDQAVAALVGLGYERREAELAVRKAAKPGMSTEEVIRTVLKG